MDWRLHQTCQAGQVEKLPWRPILSLHPPNRRNLRLSLASFPAHVCTFKRDPNPFGPANPQPIPERRHLNGRLTFGSGEDREGNKGTRGCRPGHCGTGYRAGRHLDDGEKVATMATKGGDAMASVGIKELKNRLTHYLRRTKQGEELIVTERGRPIALIQPIQVAQRVVSLEARLARLAAQGLVTLPTGKPLQRVRLAKVSGPPVSRTILEDRR